ncbi:hypothetical protein D9M70_593690 [compost metagenome]
MHAESGGKHEGVSRPQQRQPRPAPGGNASLLAGLLERARRAAGAQHQAFAAGTRRQPQRLPQHGFRHAEAVVAEEAQFAAPRWHDDAGFAAPVEQYRFGRLRRRRRAGQHAVAETAQDQAVMGDGRLAALVRDQLRAHRRKPRGRWRARAEVAQP